LINVYIRLLSDINIYKRLQTDKSLIFRRKVFGIISGKKVGEPRTESLRRQKISLDEPGNPLSKFRSRQFRAGF